MTEIRPAPPEPSDLAPYLPNPGSVAIFSAVWCGYCRRLKLMLDRSEIPYREVLIEEDAVAEQLAIDINGGDWLIPTVVFSDGSTAVNPGLRGVLDGLARIAAAE